MTRAELLGKARRWGPLAGVGAAVCLLLALLAPPAPPAPRPDLPPASAAPPGEDDEAPPPEAPVPPSIGPAFIPPMRPPRTGLLALKEKLPVTVRGGPLIPLGDQLTSDGVPMNIAVYETAEPPSEVLAFYARHFNRNKWPWQGLKRTGEVVPYPALSATDIDQGVQLSVMVMPNQDESGSTVVLSLADMVAFKAESAPRLEDLPRYPDTQPQAVRARDAEQESLTVSFDTPDAPAKVEAFYREQLKKQGYVEAEAPMTAAPGKGDLRMLRFASGQGEWQLALTAAGKRTEVVAQRSRAAREGRP